MVRVVENSRNFPIDISQEPTAFPTDTVSFEWTRGVRPLISDPGVSLTYFTVTFSNIDRQDSGNYFVFASNVVEDREVGNDTGSFNLNVICKHACLSVCLLPFPLRYKAAHIIMTVYLASST